MTKLTELPVLSSGTEDDLILVNQTGGDYQTSKSELLKERTLNVASIPDLPPVVIGNRVSVTGYQPGSIVGGGGFVGKPGVHDGITAIDPTRTYPTPAEWANGSSDPAVIAWYATTGGTVDCWVRTDVDVITPYHSGCKGDGSNEILPLQQLFFSKYRDRIGGSGSFKIESTLKLRSGTRVIGFGYREFRLYTDADRNINLLQPENTGGTLNDITTDVWLENMEWDHNRVTDFTSETLMTFLCLCMKRVRVKNILITNPNTDGIYISDTYGGLGNVLNQPDDIIIEDFKCTGDHHNRNGISVITGTNITLRDHEYINMSRNDMPGSIDLEPNDTTQLIKDVHIENIRFTNCKQGLVSDFVADKTDNTRIQNVTVKDIFVNGTPVQDGTYEEFVGSNSTCGVFMGRVTNLKISSATVASANSTSMEFDNCSNVTIDGPTIQDARSHGIVFRDCDNVKLDNYDIDCVNGLFNGVKTKGIYFTYRVPGLGHIGVRDANIGKGTVNLQEIAIADTFAIAGIGNIKDLDLSGMTVAGEWDEAVFQGDGSSGWPDNWSMSYKLDENYSGGVAKFGITAGQTVNGKWVVPGHTNGTVTITANTDIFVPTPFRVNNQSIFSCSLLTSNAEPCSVNTSTAGNIQLVFPSATTATIFWQLEKP